MSLPMVTANDNITEQSFIQDNNVDKISNIAKENDNSNHISEIEDYNSNDDLFGSSTKYFETKLWGSEYKTYTFDYNELTFLPILYDNNKEVYISDYINDPTYSQYGKVRLVITDLDKDKNQ